MIKWQSEQLPYPLDADYHGAKAGIFDLDDDIQGNFGGDPPAGIVFMYLFRRFGYPRFGWDGLKKLTQYHITTPMAGVALTVEPNVTGGGTFGYMLREDIDQACTEEDRKPNMDWFKRCVTWTIESYGIEIIQTFETDPDTLNRVFNAWGADKEEDDFKDKDHIRTAFYDDQSKLFFKYTDMYAELEPRPKPTRIEDRPDDSIIKQCHTALCTAIKDLLRPVYVRDVMFNIRGFIGWKELINDDDAVKYAAVSGCGVGDELESD